MENGKRVWLNPRVFRAARSASGITVKKVVQHLGITKQLCWCWCIGRCRPRLGQIKKIAELLGLLDYSLLISDVRPTKPTRENPSK